MKNNIPNLKKKKKGPSNWKIFNKKKRKLCFQKKIASKAKNSIVPQ